MEKAGTPAGQPIVFHKDDPKFASDLSFMTDEDWAKYKRARRIKELREIARIKKARLEREAQREKEWAMLKKESLFVTLFDQIVTEAKTLKRIGPKTVDQGDLSNFLFANTDGGKEMFTVYGIREVDSKTDPRKKAGQPMIITGRLGSCKESIKKSTFRSPKQDAAYQYKHHDNIKMCVTSVDNVDYTKKPAHKRTRQIKASSIKKIVVGGETYHVV